MNWFFLTLGLVSAWLTYNVRQPVRSGHRARIFGFFAGWFWGELALHVIAVHVLLITLFALGGAIEGFAGVVGLLLMLGSCAVLANIYVDSSRAAPIMERVLRDGLGDRYADAVAPELRSKFERRTRWRDIARPFKFDRAEVEVIRDIRFAREKGVNSYKENQAQPLLAQLAARGWVCVNCDYRLSPHATFPEHLIDCKRAIQWIKENIERYGGDPDFIVVTGGSAGGHLSTLVALTANDKRYQPGFEDVDTAVKACVPFYGVYDMANRHGFHTPTGLPVLLEKTVLKGAYDEISELYRDASPIDLVRSDAPPFLVIHGDCDSLAPVEDARVFAELLGRESSSPVLYAELPGAQHGFDVFHCLRAQQVVDAIERFAQFCYSAHLSAAEPKGESTAPVRSKHAASGGKRGAAARKKPAGESQLDRASVAKGKDRSKADADDHIARLPRSKQEATRARSKAKAGSKAQTKTATGVRKPAAAKAKKSVSKRSSPTPRKPKR
jgi:acetyl esterase/lipase